MVAGLVAPRFLHGDGRLPLDLQNTTYTLYDEAGMYEDERTGITRQLHMDIQNPANDEIASLRVGETLFQGDDGSEFDNLIHAQTWSWEIDRVTGQPLTPANLSSVMVMPSTEVDMGGPWLKLPVDTQADNISVFDPYIRGAAHAAAEGAEDKNEAVTSYRQVIEPVRLASLYPAMPNTKTVTDEEGNAEQLFLVYEADRVLDFHNTTGVLVGMQEDVQLYYENGEGDRVENYVSYSAATSDDQARLDELNDVASQSTSEMWRWIVMGLGAILALLGLIGAFRPGGQRRVFTQ